MILFLLLFLFSQQALSSLNTGAGIVHAVGNNDADPVTILFFGDSITAGYGIDPDQAFPALIQKKADSLGWNIRAINAGLSGETSSGGLRRIDWVLRQNIDILVLELGANDGLRGINPDLTKTNLQQIIDRARARYPDIAIVIAGMQVPPNLGQEYTEQFRTMFIDLARENNAALIPFILEGVAGEPDLNLPDGIHPTPEGHRIMTETVWRVIEPVIADVM
jgi:acyl-CoA thioesterase I